MSQRMRHNETNQQTEDLVNDDDDDDDGATVAVPGAEG